MRHLIVIFGDQLDEHSSVFEDFSPAHDAIWMAETAEETTHVWCHQLRIALFLSGMRHFREHLRQQQWTVHYHELTATPSADRGHAFTDILQADLARLKPQKLISVQPGDHRVFAAFQQFSAEQNIPWELRPDQHFYCPPEAFAEWAEGRKQLRLEYFYRWQRTEHNVLMTAKGQPIGDVWNFDHENRDSFGKEGPKQVCTPLQFSPDDLTQQVLQLVCDRFGSHPGTLDQFSFPVTREQAQQKLGHFIEHGLPRFGRYEDAMWQGETYLFHSHLSACMNLKLLSPRECVTAAVQAYENGTAPLNSVEGFVRQILGWREFVRGLYWLKMPEYATLNYFDHQAELPAYFWNGQTDMACVHDSMQHVLQHGYAHHIHRLMVLGNLSLLLGTHPYRFHEWHMAMYIDAIDWVSLPNTLGMSQYGDGGLVGSKPYISSGNYIHEMSNYCASCRFHPKHRIGPRACPFTTLYWDFLDRHHAQLKQNPRMKFQLKNLERLREHPEELAEIRRLATQLKTGQDSPDKFDEVVI